MSGELLSPIMPGGPAYARYISRAPYVVGDPNPLAFGTIGRVFLTPLGIAYPVIIDQIYYQIHATSAGNIRMGIYREGTTPDSPVGAALVVESASVAQGAIGVIQRLPIVDTLLVRGQYWIALQGDDVTSTCHVHRELGTTFSFRYDRGGGYGAFTNPCPALTAFTDLLVCGVRVKTNLGF